MNSLIGNSIEAWEKVNDIANICSIILGVLTTISAIILYQSSGKVQSLKDQKLDKQRIEANVKISQANSNSEKAKETSLKLENQNMVLKKELEERKIEANNQSKKIIEVEVTLANAKEKQANAEKELLILQERFEPRSLSKLQIEKLDALCQKYSRFKNRIYIMFPTDVPETQAFAKQIADTFAKNRWEVNFESLTYFGHSIAGNIIYIHDIKSQPMYAGDLQKVLKEIGMKEDAIINNICKPNELVLYIGTKE